MATLGDLLVRVGADIDAFKDGMAAVNQELRDVTKEVNASTKGWAAAFSQLQSVGLGLSAAITAPLVGVAAAATSMSEQLNMAKLSFTTMLGSAEKAGTFLESLKNFAASTPFEFPDLVTAAKRMMAMGFEAQNVVPTLRIIGDAVAALGGGKDVIDRVTLALGQMSAKGKVSAQEMNQLAENGIPAWKMLSDSIGVSIPQAMKLAEQGAISASVAIPAILKGMNDKFGGQMEVASKTLTGVWSNFKDQTTFILMDIGNVLAPILKDLVNNVAMPFLNWVKDVTTWFGNLDPTMQKVILGFTALAAAIGPIVLVVGTFGQAWIGVQTAIAVIGPLVTGLGTALAGITAPVWATAAAIAAVGAALVAFGVWVANNWDPIINTLAVAWDGVKQAFDAFGAWLAGWAVPVFSAVSDASEKIFGPIVAFHVNLWNDVKSVAVSTWDAISSALKKVWDALKTAAEKAWGFIADSLDTFIAAARKIPGVAKLLDLGKTFQENQKAAADAKAAQDWYFQSLKAGSQATADATSVTKTHTLALTDKHAKIKALVTATEEVKFEELAAKVTTDALRLSFEAFNVTAIDAAKWLALLKTGNELLADVTRKTEADIRKVPDAIRLINDATLSNATKQVELVDNAYKTLGMTSTAVLLKHKQDAIDAFEAIKNSGTATPRDIEAAYGQMQAAIGKVNKDLMTESEFAWDKMSKDIGSAMGRASTSAIKTLFTDPGSFGEKSLSILKDLGAAILDIFLKPLEDGIAKLMSGVIADLLGGKGFGGMLDSIKSIGEGIKDIFGATSGAASSAAGAAGQAGGVASSGASAGSSAAGSAASGVAGVVGAIGSVVSAISGVIGNFQMAGMNKTLDLIEKEVREQKLNTLLAVVPALQHIDTFSSNIWEAAKTFVNDHAWRIHDVWSELVAVNTKLQAAVSGLGSIDQILGSIFTISDNNLQIAMAMNANMAAIVADTRPNVTINATQADPRALAQQIIDILRTAGVIR